MTYEFLRDYVHLVSCALFGLIAAADQAAFHAFIATLVAFFFLLPRIF